MELKSSTWSCTRRELLKAIVGMPLAVAACRSPPQHFPGRLLGTSASLGHRLLHNETHHYPTPQKINTIIVGGGIAGLSAAWHLQRRGRDDFMLLELEAQLGGTSASGERQGLAFPWGAHYVCTPTGENQSLVTLLQEVGAVERMGADGSIVWDEETLCQAPQERLFYRGRWIPGLYLSDGASSEDLRQLHAFEHEMDAWAGRYDRQGRRVFALPVAHGSTDPEFTSLDALSFASYLDKHGWTSPRLRAWADYACRDDYGLRLEETSAWAGIFYYASRIARAGGKAAEFLTWPAGNGHIVNHLRQRLAEHLRTNAMVFDIVPGSADVEVRFIDAQSGQPQAYRAQHVICATPTFVTKHLLAPWRASVPSWLASFAYTPWVVANIALRALPRSRGYPLAWDNVFYDSSSLGYVDATHQLAQPHTQTIWTWYMPLCGPDPKAARRLLYLADREHWCDAILADLRRAHPNIGELIESIDVWRWGHAMVRPSVGFLWGGALQQAQRPLGRVHFAHTDLSGLPLFEEAHFHGVRAAQAILDA